MGMLVSSRGGIGWESHYGEPLNGVWTLDFDHGQLRPFDLKISELRMTPTFELIGFGLGYAPNKRMVIVPMWVVVILTGVLPAIWWKTTSYRMRRRRTGRCAVCGYDLRHP